LTPRKRNYQIRKEWIPDGRFGVGYAGNLGRAHDIDTILSAMTILQDRAVMSPADPAAKVMFLFVGDGAKRAKLEREAMRRTLTNFRMRPINTSSNYRKLWVWERFTW
jgi:colanic acid biosynthesis glycosyl transferase WcaI